MALTSTDAFVGRYTVATPPASTKSSLQQRLSRHARDRWPALARVAVRFHGQFAYIDGHLAERGKALLLAGSHRVAFQTVASAREHQLAATSPGFDDTEDYDGHN